MSQQTYQAQDWNKQNIGQDFKQGEFRQGEFKQGEFKQGSNFPQGQDLGSGNLGRNEGQWSAENAEGGFGQGGNFDKVTGVG